MEEDLVNGDGSTADFTNAYGDQYIANQTAYDVADNGALTKSTTTTGTTTASSSNPTWLDSITGVLNQGVKIAGTVNSTVKTFTDKPNATGAGQATAANTKGGAAAGSSAKSSYLPWIIGGIVAVVAAVFFLRK